jgi:hypothetical protein
MQSGALYRGPDLHRFVDAGGDGGFSAGQRRLEAVFRQHERHPIVQVPDAVAGFGCQDRAGEQVIGTSSLPKTGEGQRCAVLAGDIERLLGQRRISVPGQSLRNRIDVRGRVREMAISKSFAAVYFFEIDAPKCET